VAEYCVIEEEVGRHGLVPPQISIQGQRWLIDWGTAEQKERYLGPMARGELIFSESISEPGVGSSLKLMRSTLRRDGGDWVLNGTKTHVNLGHQSDVTLVFAVAEEGLTSILVDMNLPGVSSKQTDPIGLRLIPTADMYFDNVRVPDSALLGAPGRGMDTFLTTFNVSRLGNASELLGFGRRALAHATRYAEARQVGDNVVTDFQGIKWTVADRYAELYAAALARNNAARLLDRGDEPALATSLAKKLCIDAAEHAVNDAFALIGGHGLYTDTDFGQLMHDVKVLRIAGGSVEVLRNYIARRVLRSETLEGLE
jgi:alkylation response protein AidB-like acyl-CoA dehydrogenase